MRTREGVNVPLAHCSVNATLETAAAAAAADISATLPAAVTPAAVPEIPASLAAPLFGRDLPPLSIGLLASPLKTWQTFRGAYEQSRSDLATLRRAVQAVRLVVLDNPAVPDSLKEAIAAEEIPEVPPPSDPLPSPKPKKRLSLVERLLTDIANFTWREWLRVTLLVGMPIAGVATATVLLVTPRKKQEALARRSGMKFAINTAALLTFLAGGLEFSQELVSLLNTARMLGVFDGTLKYVHDAATELRDTLYKNFAETGPAHAAAAADILEGAPLVDYEPVLNLRSSKVKYLSAALILTPLIGTMAWFMYLGLSRDEQVKRDVHLTARAKALADRIVAGASVTDVRDDVLALAKGLKKPEGTLATRVESLVETVDNEFELRAKLEALCVDHAKRAAAAASIASDAAVIAAEPVSAAASCYAATVAADDSRLAAASAATDARLTPAEVTTAIKEAVDAALAAAEAHWATGQKLDKQAEDLRKKNRQIRDAVVASAPAPKPEAAVAPAPKCASCSATCDDVKSRLCKVCYTAWRRTPAPRVCAVPACSLKVAGKGCLCASHYAGKDPAPPAAAADPAPERKKTAAAQSSGDGANNVSQKVGRSRKRGAKLAAAAQALADAHESADAAENGAAATWDEEALVAGSTLYNVTSIHNRSIRVSLDEGRVLGQAFLVGSYLYTNRHVISHHHSSCKLTYFDFKTNKVADYDWTNPWQYCRKVDRKGRAYDIARSPLKGISNPPNLPVSKYSLNVFKEISDGSQIHVTLRDLSSTGELAATGNILESLDGNIVRATYSTFGEGSSGAAVRYGPNVIGIHVGNDEYTETTYFLLFNPAMFPDEFVADTSDLAALRAAAKAAKGKDPVKPPATQPEALVSGKGLTPPTWKQVAAGGSSKH